MDRLATTVPAVRQLAFIRSEPRGPNARIRVRRTKPLSQYVCRSYVPHAAHQRAPTGLKIARRSLICIVCSIVLANTLHRRARHAQSPCNLVLGLALLGQLDDCMPSAPVQRMISHSSFAVTAAVMVSQSQCLRRTTGSRQNR